MHHPARRSALFWLLGRCKTSQGAAVFASIVRVIFRHVDMTANLPVMNLAAAGGFHDQAAADVVRVDIARTDRAEYDIAADAFGFKIAGADRVDMYATVHVAEMQIARADAADFDFATHVADVHVARA